VQIKYYIEPAEQTDEVNAQLAAITPSTLNPEELTLIDPASGSGHILVEAYEVFKAIYLERGYRQRDVAKLILEKNLFGLDIDERAAQLTGFALMMKGRADDRRLFERGVKLNVMALVDSTEFDAERLTNGVELSDYGLKPGDLTELKRMFEHATTFGSLIQVQEAFAKRLPGLRQLSEATSQDLFVSEALKRLGPLVQQTEVLAAQYDAVVANPPYIGSTFHIPVLKKFLKDHYDGYEKDVFSAFIDRDLALSKPHARLGFMSPFVWMFISSHAHLRMRLINKENITSLVQLEYSGFEGATVPICTFTLRKSHVNGEKGCFVRLSDFRGSDNQGPKTLEAIRNRGCGWFFEASQDEFKKIPGSPVAYWLPSPIFAAFADRPHLGQTARAAKGLVTADNGSFVRERWEVSADAVGLGFASREEARRSGKTWFPYAKGGKFRRWAGNLEAVVNWEQDGAAIQTTLTADGSRVRATNFNLDRIFIEGASWTVVTSGAPSFRFVPRGHLFDAAAGVIQKRSDTCSSWALLAYLNTGLVRILLDALNPTLNLHPGYLESLPGMDSDSRLNSEATAKAAVAISERDWNAYERSWNFQYLPLLTASTDRTPTLESSYTAWTTQNRETIAEMKRLEEENNRLFIDAYGLADELTPDVPIEQITLTVNPAYRYGGKLTEEDQWTRFRQDTMEELVSYAVGCMMGRYSLDEPGLIYAHSGNEGFDPSRYASFAADDDGIVPLTDTEWFDDDAAHRLIEFISVAWDPAHLEDNLTFLADNLSPKKNESSRDTIRRYLCDKIFKDHLKTYKKRPIYWLFASGKQKASQCLVYLHRYNEGTLARMRSEYVIPLQGKMAARIEQLQGDIQVATSTAHQGRLEKERAKLEKQQVELLAFDEKLRHYADRRITLDLNDGVKVNYGKFGDLLSEVKKVHGKKPEG
jgi:type II restriction/modification system DNA methylase subunit YeeA